MATPDESTVKLTLDAVERLMRMFHTERVIYLGMATGAFLLLGFAAFMMLRDRQFSLDQAGLLFGSGGLFAVSSARVVRYLDRTYNLVEDILRHLTGLDPRRDS